MIHQQATRKLGENKKCHRHNSVKRPLMYSPAFFWAFWCERSPWIWSNTLHYSKIALPPLTFLKSGPWDLGTQFWWATDLYLKQALVFSFKIQSWLCHSTKLNKRNLWMRFMNETSPLVHGKSIPSSLLTSAGEGTYPDSTHVFSITSSLSWTQNCKSKTLNWILINTKWRRNKKRVVYTSLLVNNDIQIH